MHCYVIENSIVSEESFFFEDFQKVKQNPKRMKDKSPCQGDRIVSGTHAS